MFNNHLNSSVSFLLKNFLNLKCLGFADVGSVKSLNSVFNYTGPLDQENTSSPNYTAQECLGILHSLKVCSLRTFHKTAMKTRSFPAGYVE